MFTREDVSLFVRCSDGTFSVHHPPVQLYPLLQRPTSTFALNETSTAECVSVCVVAMRCGTGDRRHHAETESEHHQSGGHNQQLAGDRLLRRHHYNRDRRSRLCRQLLWLLRRVHGTTVMPAHRQLHRAYFPALTSTVFIYLQMTKGN